MEIHRYYVTRRESIYCLVAVIGSCLFYIYIEDIGVWMISRNFDLGGMIVRYSPYFRNFGIISGTLFFMFFSESLGSRSKPGFVLCSHFLIIHHVPGTEVMSWEEIHSIQIVGNNVRIGLDLDSMKVRRKRSIKRVRNREGLVKEIQEYCGKYEIEFSQEPSE